MLASFTLNVTQLINDVTHVSHAHTEVVVRSNPVGSIDRESRLHISQSSHCKRTRATVSSNHLILQYARALLCTKSHAIRVNTCVRKANGFMLLLSQVIVTASGKLSGHLAREVDFSSSNPTLTPSRHLNEAKHVQTLKQNRSIPYSLKSKQNTQAESHFAGFVQSSSAPTLTLSKMLKSSAAARMCKYDRINAGGMPDSIQIYDHRPHPHIPG